MSSLNQSTSLTLSPGVLLVMLQGRDTELPTMLVISVTAPLSRLAMAPVSCLVSQEITDSSSVTSVTLVLTIMMTVITPVLSPHVSSPCHRQSLITTEGRVAAAQSPARVCYRARAGQCSALPALGQHSQKIVRQRMIIPLE